MQVPECADGAGRSTERVGAGQPRRMPVVDAHEVGRVGGAKNRTDQGRQLLRGVRRRLQPQKGSEIMEGSPERVGRVGRLLERSG